MAGRVLVVDSEEAIRNLVAKFLSQKGYECDVADGIQLAQKKLLASQFDILLTAKNIPYMEEGDEGGLELIRWAHQHQPNLAIIVMTGYPTLDSALEALKLGAFDYLIKPLDLSAVEQKVQRLSEYRKLVNPAAILNLYLDLNRQILQTGDTSSPNREAQRKKSQEVLDHLFFALRTAERVLLEHRQRLAEIAAYAEQCLDEIPMENPAHSLLKRIADEASHRL
jgi:DNA-binding NtrC family response regulator